MGEVQNGPGTDLAMQVVSFAASFSQNVAASVAGAWLWAYFEKHKAKRFRINGREPADRAELDRIVAEEFNLPARHRPVWHKP
jgi:hypothetical protein